MDKFLEINNEKYLVRHIVRNVVEQDILNYKSLDEYNEVLQKDGQIYFCVRLKNAEYEDIIE